MTDYLDTATGPIFTTSADTPLHGSVDTSTMRVRDLRDWWFDTSNADIQPTLEKAVEYGSQDLIDMGRTMLRLVNGNTDASDGEAIEAGIWFYVLGKVGRWTNAIEHGQRVSMDTLHDITVYSMMARRARETGGWPGV